jgi:hypothetical protein
MSALKQSVRSALISVFMLALVFVVSYAISSESVAQAQEPTPGGLEKELGTPTPTPTSAAQSKPSPTPLADVSIVLLALGDLPTGFKPQSSAELETALSKAQSANSAARPRAVTYLNSDRGTVVVHLLLYPLSTLERVTWGTLIDRETATKFLVNGLMGSDVQVKESAAIPGMDKLGDASTGVTIAASAPDWVMRLDAVITRRGPFFSILFALYREGDQSPVSIVDLAKMLDGRTAAALTGSSSQAPATRIPPTPVPTRSPCGELPPGMAGLLWINRFPGEATVTLTDHEYHVPGNSQMLILIPAGKKFVIEAFIPGVGRLNPKLGPYTWEGGECHVLNPGNRPPD